MKRGELWWASLQEPTGSEPGYRRPLPAGEGTETRELNAIAHPGEGIEERITKTPNLLRRSSTLYPRTGFFCRCGLAELLIERS